MNKKTAPESHTQSSEETRKIRATSVIHARFEKLISLTDTLQNSIELADGVVEKLRIDLLKVLENPYGYSKVSVRFERNGQNRSHDGLLYYNDPWKNTNAVGPIMTMLASDTPPGKKAIVKGIDFVEGLPPSWIKRR